MSKEIAKCPLLGLMCEAEGCDGHPQRFIDGKCLGTTPQERLAFRRDAIETVGSQIWREWIDAVFFYRHGKADTKKEAVG